MTMFSEQFKIYSQIKGTLRDFPHSLASVLTHPTEKFYVQLGNGLYL